MLTSALALKSISNHKTLYHRPRLERRFVQVSTALLCGYEALSDGAKVTYQVLLSFDYVDKRSGEHKGIVNPSIETIMTMRHKSRSTIYSHLAELEQCGLIETIPGEGYRLYNAQEDETDAEHCLYAPMPSQDARANHSAPQPPSCEHSGRSSVNRTAEAANTLTVWKSGRLLIDEEDSQETEQYQYSEAGEREHVVEKLVKLGFDRHLARQFVSRYTVARVEDQITNLCRELQSGVVIRSYPRWLYRAIERDYLCGDSCPRPPDHSPRHKLSIGEAMTLPNGERVYTVLEYSDEG